MENEPLGDITRSDDKDVAANNNKESGTTHNDVLNISTLYII